MAIGSEYEDIISKACPDIYDLTNSVRALDQTLNTFSRSHPEFEYLCDRFSTSLSEMYQNFMYSAQSYVDGTTIDMQRRFGVPDHMKEKLREMGFGEFK